MKKQLDDAKAAAVTMASDYRAELGDAILLWSARSRSTQMPYSAAIMRSVSYEGSMMRLLGSSRSRLS